MKYAFVFVFASLVFSICSTPTIESQKHDPQSAIQNSKSPVLIELYTSEGCSSCPPADKALAFLEKEQPFANAEIITLALHVDYWNYLGWKDEFSQPLFSQRQTVYAQKMRLDSTYTPQMIVDGRIQFVGSNLGEAAKAIAEAAKLPKANVEIASDGDNLKIKVSAVPEHTDATVFLAIAEDNLASNVRRGENAGKSLAHVSVVRELKTIGKIAAKTNEYEQNTTLALKPDWKRENLKYVVFVQENDSRKILGIEKKTLNKTEISVRN